MFDKCDKDIVTSVHPRAGAFFLGGGCVIWKYLDGCGWPMSDIISQFLKDEKSAWRDAAARLKKVVE